MTKYKFIYIAVAALIFSGTACKKQLNVGNPNQPTIASNVNSESGLIALTQGSTYINGFVNGDGWLGDSYFSLPYGFSELLGDAVGADAANQEISVLSVPDKITFDDGTTLVNNSPHIPFLRAYNTRGNTGAGDNVYYYQWLNMYALNNACNTILSLVDGVKFSGDATTKANTIRAWCYWWKGYAYASIGSMYYSGLLIDTYGGASNHYVVKDSVLAQSNLYFKEASTVLSGLTANADYNTVLGGLIPLDFQKGHGGIPSPADWIKNINTMLARNILVNKLNPFVHGVLNATITKSSTTPMTAADWQAVSDLASAGITDPSVVVFSGHSSTNTSVFSPAGRTASSLTTSTNTNTTFKITERFMQNFNTGDKRVDNNFAFDAVAPYDNPNFGTRYSIIDGGNGLPGVYMYGSLTAGVYEVYMAGSYEENALMLAEANIMLGKVDAGVAFINAVRAYQGAGVTPLANGLTATQAMTELVKERRVALVFRGLTFYDSRRWGWIYSIANGGGYYGAAFWTTAHKLYTNSTIDYNFLDYWDIPADETVLNPPGAGSAAVINPNF